MRAATFVQQRNGVLPQDLRQLVGEGRYRLSPGNLVSLQTYLKLDSRDAVQPYDGPVDFAYLPQAVGRGDDLLYVWEDPKFNEGEGGYVARPTCAILPQSTARRTSR
jgi:hypothetical protein